MPYKILVFFSTFFVEPLLFICIITSKIIEIIRLKGFGKNMGHKY